MTGALALGLWQMLGRVAAPVLPAYLKRRIKRGKEDPSRWREKTGVPSATRPAGHLVWIHAASVGEMMSVIGLIERLHGDGRAVLLTTGTVTSAEAAVQRLGDRVIHQYAPLDAAPYVAAFLDHWQPDLALVVESEIWPATFTALQRRHVPLVLLNARLSERAARGWARAGGLARAIFGVPSLVLTQTEADAARFRAAGAGQVAVSGNLKFDAAPPPCDEAELARIVDQIGARPVWLAASTHDPEEMMAGEAHRALNRAGLLTIIVPRHPARGGEIATMLGGLGLNVARRSLGETIRQETDIYLGDTLGEMGLFCRLASIAFVGGTFGTRGGQSPIEAALLDTAILHGPDFAKATEIYNLLDGVGAARTVRSVMELSTDIGKLLGDPELSSEMARVGRDAIGASAGALNRTLTALEPFLTTRGT